MKDYKKRYIPKLTVLQISNSMFLINEVGNDK